MDGCKVRQAAVRGPGRFPAGWRWWWLAPAAAALLWAAVAHAQGAAEGPGVDPGVRIGTWLQRNVAALFAPLLAAGALYHLVKRQFTQFLSFAVFAALASLFVFGASEFKDAAVAFVRWVIGR